MILLLKNKKAIVHFVQSYLTFLKRQEWLIGHFITNTRPAKIIFIQRKLIILQKRQLTLRLGVRLLTFKILSPFKNEMII